MRTPTAIVGLAVLSVVAYSPVVASDDIRVAMDQRFEFPPAGVDTFASDLKLEFDIAGFGRLNATTSGTTYVTRSDLYYDQYGIQRIDTEIVDSHMRGSHRLLGDIDIYIGSCYGLESTCGTVHELPGRQDSVWSGFAVKPRFVVETLPGLRSGLDSPAGLCPDEGDSIIMISKIGGEPPCGSSYSPPGLQRVTFIDCCTGEIVVLQGGLVHLGHNPWATPAPPPPPRNRRIEIPISDFEADSGATAAYTQIKIVNDMDCTDILIDSGPVTLDGGEAPRETAYLLASALSDSLVQAPNCDCDIDTVDTGGRDGLITVDCRFTFGTINACLEGTDVSSPGVLLDGPPVYNRHQLYGNQILDEDTECEDHEIDWPCFGYTLSVPGGEIGPRLPPSEEPALQVSPNPASALGVTIHYSLSTVGPVSLYIYDSTGRLVRGVSKPSVLPGERTFEWDGLGSDGRAVPPGVYWFRMFSRDGERSGKAVILR